jgi:putative intracellular protease/amidase
MGSFAYGFPPPAGINFFALPFDIQIGDIVTQHVLFIVTNAATIGPHNRKTGFFFAEVAHPFEVLDEAGVAVEFASIAGG